MTLKKTIFYSWCFYAILLAVLAYSLHGVWAGADARANAQEKRRHSLLLAAELQQSSQDLTNYVRMFAVTGEQSFVERYWDVVHIRNGEKARPADRATAPGEKISLTKLMEKAGFTSREFALLKKAGSLSDSLIALETEAINAVNGLFKDASGTYTVKGEPNKELAARLVFSEEYRTSVRTIMEPISQFQEILNERLETTLADASRAFQTALVILVGVVALVMAGLALFLVMLKHKIVNPILKCDNFAQHVSHGNFNTTLEYSGTNEIGSLAASLIAMVAALRDRIAQSEAATAKAEAQSDLASKAVQEAQSARSAAEKAKSEGMRQAGEQLLAIANRAKQAAESLSMQIARANKGADNQQQRLTETAHTMEQLNQVVLEVARNTSSTTDSAEKARQNAVAGSEIVHNLVQAISEVDANTNTLRGSLGSLGEQADGIGRVMGVITDIADQTNLLALNAAIEAARAGDAGRGFAVVADEVRKLAEKTMQATGEVGTAVRTIQDGAARNIQEMETTSAAVANCTNLAKSAGEALLSIVSLVKGTAEMIQSIAVSAEEQSNTCEEITKTTEAIKDVACDTLNTMQDARKAVSDINSVVEQITVLTKELRSA